jgi:17-hydroxy-3-oxo-4-pregnene-20-carboxyl-CoA lyase
VEMPFYGGSACAAVATAAAAVHAGIARNVLVYRSCTPWDFAGFARKSAAVVWATQAGVAEFLRPYGWLSMMDTYALVYEAHRAKYGTTTDQLGHIAVAIRAAAQKNPNALLGHQPLTLEDHRNSPLVSGRLTAADIVMGASDGACAVLVTSLERARDLRQPPAVILGAASGMGPKPSLNWEMHLFREDPTVSPAAWAAPRLFEMAGLRPSDVDVAQIYDCSTMNALLQLEDYGFCEKGEGGAFAASGALGVGGSLPITTSGGLLAEANVHGVNLVTEGVRQVRGTSTAQVPDVEVSLVTSSVPCPTSAVLLGTSR